MKRDEIETLLPWYAAGTLSRSDADRVEQALASDQELAQCFELIRKELAETIYLNETLGAISACCREVVRRDRCGGCTITRAAPSALRSIALSAGLPLA
jgi:anti-sigma-K factor RskA